MNSRGCFAALRGKRGWALQPLTLLKNPISLPVIAAHPFSSGLQEILSPYNPHSAAQFKGLYLQSDQAGREKLLLEIQENHGVDLPLLEESIRGYRGAGKEGAGKEEQQLSAIKIKEASTPKYDHLFSSVAQMAGGLSFLIDIRKDLMVCDSFFKERKKEVLVHH